MRGGCRGEPARIPDTDEGGPMRTTILLALILTLSACVPIGLKTQSLPLASEPTAARA
jgi:hypothetical protein